MRKSPFTVAQWCTIVITSVTLVGYVHAQFPTWRVMDMILKRLERIEDKIDTLNGAIQSDKD